MGWRVVCEFLTMTQIKNGTKNAMANIHEDNLIVLSGMNVGFECNERSRFAYIRSELMDVRF